VAEPDAIVEDANGTAFRVVHVGWCWPSGPDGDLALCPYNSPHPSNAKKVFVLEALN
jgi:hypothetical protein